MLLPYALAGATVQRAVDQHPTTKQAKEKIAQKSFGVMTLIGMDDDKKKGGAVAARCCWVLTFGPTAYFTDSDR
jgi:hypothetical protein